jgi:hypothetical protein
VRSAEPGESWVFCFADDRLLAERAGDAMSLGTRP